MLAPAVLRRSLLTSRLTYKTVALRSTASIPSHLNTNFRAQKLGFSTQPPVRMEAIKNTLAQNLGGVAHSLAADHQKFDIEKDVPDLSGKVAVITGGSEGIGYAAGFSMLRQNLAKLYILALRQEVFDGAVNDVKEKLGADKSQRMTFIQIDVADLPAVTKVAQQIRDSTDRLDILCLNAARGIMTYETHEQSGIDRHFMANHVGHVTLTSHLLPLLKKTAEKGTVRIQTQASNAHEMAPKDTKFASVDELNQDLGPNPLYGRSKLAGILYARYLTAHLHKEHPNILINATHPGIVETKMSVEDIHEPYPILGYGMSTLASPFKKSQWEGSASTLYAATKTENSGEYICPPAMVEPGSELSRDPALGEQLMKLTSEIIQTKYGPQSVDKGCPVKAY